MLAGWNMEDIGLAAFMVAVLAFLVFCIVLGRRRWAFIRQSNEKALRLSEEAVADRKRILAVLEDIKSHLQDRKT